MTLIILLYGPGPGRTSSASSSHREPEHVDKAYFHIPSSCPHPRLPAWPPSTKATQTPKVRALQSPVPFLHRHLAPYAHAFSSPHKHQAPTGHAAHGVSTRLRPGFCCRVFGHTTREMRRNVLVMSAVLASENSCCVRNVRGMALVQREFCVGGLVLCYGSVWGRGDGVICLSHAVHDIGT